MSDEVFTEIFARYTEEMACVEEEAERCITRLTLENLECIKYTAAAHHNDSAYDFSGLMTELAVACTEARLGLSPQTVSEGETDRAVTVLAANDILTGKHIQDVPSGGMTTLTGTATISLSAGSTVSGVQLTAGYSKSVSYSFSGPTDGLKLNNGAGVTHRTYFAVLYGTAVQSFGRRYIDPDTAVVMVYSILASIAIPTYCGQARNAGTLYFADPVQYCAAFSFPSPFL